jgi:hypothetical protein
MPIPSSGAISFEAIQTEFGGTNPISLNEYYDGGGLVPSGTSGDNGAIPTSGAISVNQFYGTAKVLPSQQAFITPGNFTWVAPAGVRSVSAVAVGGGGNNLYYYPAAGGGLGWKNNISVTPGTSYSVKVGCQNEDSFFINANTVAGKTATSSDGNQFKDVGGTYVGDGGGNGGCSGYVLNAATPLGGGGAGGYSGNGGGGARSGNCFYRRNTGQAGSGGGGGGGGGINFCGGGGGGVGILGQGASGAASGSGLQVGINGTSTSAAGNGGSGGSNGTNSTYTVDCYGNPTASSSGSGGNYGGGAGRNRTYPTNTPGSAGKGAVRLIWPGTARQFPSTRTANE